MFKYALLAATLAVASNANAELVSYDWVIDGDENVTLDTETGKLWLDLDVTANQNYSFISYYLRSKAEYSGWRFATAEEVMTLANNIFPEDGSATTSFSEQKAQHELLGRSYEWDGGYTVGGFYKDTVDEVFKTLYTDHSTSNLSEVQKEGGTGLSMYHNPKSVFYGYYIIADDASVSIDNLVIEEELSLNDVPLYGGAVAIGLFGLFANRKKKAKAI
jgi:hypothetical protein